MAGGPARAGARGPAAGARGGGPRGARGAPRAARGGAGGAGGRAAPAPPARGGAPGGLRHDLLVLDGTYLLEAARHSRRAGGAPGAGSAGAAAPAGGGAGGALDALQDRVRFLLRVVDPARAVAVFDAPGLTCREASSPGFKRRRLARAGRGRAEGAEGALPAGRKGPSPGARSVLADLGVEALVAPGGWEADDVMAATAAAAAGAAGGGVLTAVASGDRDMQQLLRPEVRWLRLLQRVAPGRPLALDLVTEERFREEHGIPPGAFADLLALTGKVRENVPGCGVGERAGRALLRRYGDLSGVLEAVERGEVRGFTEQVQGRLSDPAMRARARRNLELVALRADSALLPPAFAESLRAWDPAAFPAGSRLGVRAAAAAGDGRGTGLLEGTFSRFHREFSSALARAGAAHVNEHFSDGQLAIDVALPDRRFAIEINGPTHYGRGGDTQRPSAATRQRERQLRREGWLLRSVPWWEWEKLGGNAGRQEAYVRAVVESLEVESRIQAHVLADGLPQVRSRPDPQALKEAKKKVILGNAAFLERVAGHLCRTAGPGAPPPSAEQVNLAAQRIALQYVPAEWVLGAPEGEGGD